MNFLYQWFRSYKMHRGSREFDRGAAHYNLLPLRMSRKSVTRWLAR